MRFVPLSIMALDNSPLQTAIAGDAPVRAVSGERLHSDAMLQASRRLDWRFLLPTPDLRHVAYLGPAHGGLLESLRLFSTALHIVDSSAGEHTTAGYDVVVASDPSFAALQRAAELIKPGGFLYVEAYGWPGRIRRRLSAGRLHVRGPRLRSAAGYVAAARRLGLTEIEAYWHWPNFEACTEIIPLGDPTALVLALARRRGAQFALAIGGWLVRSGLLERMAPYFSIVARKNANATG